MSPKKNPNRVNGGKKGWQNRMKKERNLSLASIPASFVPGFGPANSAYKAYKAEKRIHKSRKK